MQQSNNRTEMDRVATLDSVDGFLLPPADFASAFFDALTPTDIARFQDSWNDLPVDAYLRAHATFRHRRYSRFAVGEDIRPLPAIPFVQATDINSVFGGIERSFPPLLADVWSSPVFEAILRAALACLPAEVNSSNYLCGVHQIRVTADPGENSSPAPEGIHRDGHDYVVQMLIGRTNAVGGESSIYSAGGTPLARKTMRSPFEMIVVDDRRVLHGVSPIGPDDGTNRAVRDMLIIDFFHISR